MSENVKSAKGEELCGLEQELECYKKLYKESIAASIAMRRELSDVKTELDRVKNSGSWKFTAPARKFAGVMQKTPPVRLTGKGFRMLRQFGVRYTLKKLKNKFKHARKLRKEILCSREMLDEQRAHIFENQVKFSVIVPLYNTPSKYLREMINSVTAQSYSNWELCLADGSDAEHSYVEEQCLAFAAEDSRIKYKKLEKNLGISDNTNAAIAMSEGDFIALFDHDDKLHPTALFEVAAAINEKGADFIYTDEAKFTKNEKKDAYGFFFKPDFSPDMLRSINYICHFTVFSRALFERVGSFRSAFDGSQDYDMILRLTEKAQNPVHIPKILYFWRCHAESVASNIEAKPYAITAAKNAILEQVSRMGYTASIYDSSILTSYRLKYDIIGEPLVSIIIPNKDHISDLELCLNSIYALSTYRNFEVVVVENNSTEEETFAFYERAKTCYPNLKVAVWEHEFNYSKINNFGFKYAEGDYIVLLNNDIEIITPEWIEEMLMFAQRSDVGAVGMKLYFADNSIQHGGVVVGIADVAGHAHKGHPKDDPGYFGRLTYAQNFSAVTAAAMMVRSSVFTEVGGLEETFTVALNDVDFCLKVGKAGYRVVWTPYAEAYHYESKSRGYEDSDEKKARFEEEKQRLHKRWGEIFEKGDPYYNPNLTLDREDFGLR